MKDFYSAYYSVIEHSQAHHEFCERAFGKDLCQHGFADLVQLERLMQVAQLSPDQHVLDLGCGNGMIAEFLSDCTGAHFTGLDYIPHAIHQAQLRTIAKSDRLRFVVGDINRLELPSNAFDVVLSIDTIYFSEDYTVTIRALKSALQPNGQMAIFFTFGLESGTPKDEFPRQMLPPDKTPLAVALRANDLPFSTWDYTQQDYQLAMLRKELLVELKPQFEADDALFIYENRLGEVEGICQAFEEGLHARYLYQAQLPRQS